MRIECAWCLLASLLLVGCGDSAAPGGTTSSSSTGAGGDGGNGSGGAPGAPDSAGIPGCASVFVDSDGICRPTLEKCPAGSIPKFAEGCVPVGIPIADCDAGFVEADGLCHPTAAKCNDGEIPVPSEGCVPVDGDGCGADTWGLVVEQPGDQYVDTAYAGGASDGSRAAPWTTIADALAAVASGKRVVVAAGEYGEPVHPTEAVSIVGRCASMVKISGSAPVSTVSAIIGVSNVSGSVSLSGLTVGGDAIGIYAKSAKVDVDGVVVDGATKVGIAASGTAEVTLHHVVVKNTLSDETNSYGGGVNGYDAATIEIQQSLLIANRLWGVGVGDGSTSAHVVDSVVEDTLLEESSQDFGYGIAANFGGSAVVDHVAITGVAGPGIAGYDADTVHAVASIVEKASGVHSLGLIAERSTDENPNVDLTADRVAVVGVDGDGFIAVDLAKAEITESLVIGGTPKVKPESGGFYTEGKAKLTIKDAAAVDNAGVGVIANDQGTELTVDGLLVEGEHEVATHDTGEGIDVQKGATGTLSRVAAFANARAGIELLGGANGSLSDSLVVGTKPAMLFKPGSGGVGVNVFASTAALSAVRVEASQSAGVAFVQASGSLDGVGVDGVTTGKLLVRDEHTPSIPGVADGILVARSADAPTAISHVTVKNAARAGILFASSMGSIDASITSDDLYGLVLQGTPVPAVGDDDSFSGTDGDILTDGSLAAP